MMENDIAFTMREESWDNSPIFWKRMGSSTDKNEQSTLAGPVQQPKMWFCIDNK